MLSSLSLVCHCVRCLSTRIRPYQICCRLISVWLEKTENSTVRHYCKADCSEQVLCRFVLHSNICAHTALLNVHGDW